VGQAVSNVLVSEEELKALLVGELGLVDEAEFERARLMATRLKMPLERAVAERGRFPFAFLLEQLAQAWGVGFIDLKVSDVHLEASRPSATSTPRATSSFLSSRPAASSRWPWSTRARASSSRTWSR